jgi:hypothetical protein
MDKRNTRNHCHLRQAVLHLHLLQMRHELLLLMGRQILNSLHVDRYVSLLREMASFGVQRRCVFAAIRRGMTVRVEMEICTYDMEYVLIHAMTFLRSLRGDFHSQDSFYVCVYANQEGIRV